MFHVQKEREIKSGILTVVDLIWHQRQGLVQQPKSNGWVSAMQNGAGDIDVIAGFCRIPM